MKKKIGDLTLKEVSEICRANHPYCIKEGKVCPLYTTEIDCCKFNSLVDLDKEVEVEEE